MSWNHKRFGTSADPIHKSDLNNITGEYGCDSQFKRAKDAEAAGEETEPRVSGKAACGNAGHETIARALSTEELRERLCSGAYQVSRKQIDEVFRQELDKEVGSRELIWGRKDNPDKIIAERVSMCMGALNNLYKYARRVVLIEPGFIVNVDGFWLSGHVDLIFEPLAGNEGDLAFGDWKTGAQKPCQIELDHGWESGIYSSAVKDGVFLDRAALECVKLENGYWQATCPVEEGLPGIARHRSIGRAQREAVEAALIQIAQRAEMAQLELNPTFGRFPSQIWHIHLQDFVPYTKSGKKEAKRPEDAAFYGVAPGTDVTYAAGDMRGPAWLPVRRSEGDIPRLAHQLRNVIGTVRMGRFAERVSEKCERCPFKNDCLNGGYGVRGDEQKQLERSLRVIGSGASMDYGDL